MRRLPETVKMINFYKTQTTADRVKLLDEQGSRFIYGFILKKEIPYPLAIKFARWNKKITINNAPIDKRDMYTLIRIIEQVVPDKDMKGEILAFLPDAELYTPDSNYEFKPLLVFARIIPGNFPPILIELNPEKFRITVDNVVKDFLLKRLNKKPRKKFSTESLS